MRLYRVVLFALVGLLLTGCGPHHSVRVEPSRSGRPAAPVSRHDQYVVIRGDTLYGIAFRHGLDYRELARANRIGAPYTIYPGQRLQLPVAAKPVAASPRRDQPAASGAPSRPASGAGVVAPIASGAAPRAPASPVPSEVARGSAPPAGSASKPTAATGAPTRPPSKPAAELPSGPPRWRWPATGSLVSTYAANDPTRQGINIAGSAGQPIHAAADGVVVYSGSGLIGYGELVIIKHSDEWLSAYGHNRKRLVGEGAAVKAGQQVAEMGRSGASRDMLHFEIRRNGKPVNPLGLLPKR